MDIDISNLTADADKGDALAQYNLGVCYAEGLGIARNLIAARRWFEKSADQKFALAEYNLGLFYLYGYGDVKRNFAEAAALLARASTHGSRAAGILLPRLLDSVPPYRAKRLPSP